MRKIVLGACACAFFAAGGAQAATEYVQNGGFETGSFSSWTLTGNTGGATYVGSSLNSSNAPHTGNYAAQLGAVGSDNFLSQTLNTVAGQAYQISFWHIYSPNAGPPGDFGVQWNGNYVFGPVESTVPPAPQSWTQYTVAVTGIGSDVLTFVSRNDPDYQGLDDVSVTEAPSIPTAAPEPAAWALMLTGVGVAGTALRRKRRLPAAA